MSAWKSTFISSSAKSMVFHCNSFVLCIGIPFVFVVLNFFSRIMWWKVSINHHIEAIVITINKNKDSFIVIIEVSYFEVLGIFNCESFACRLSKVYQSQTFNNTAIQKHHRTYFSISCIVLREGDDDVYILWLPSVLMTTMLMVSKSHLLISLIG